MKHMFEIYTTPYQSNEQLMRLAKCLNARIITMSCHREVKIKPKCRWSRWI